MILARTDDGYRFVTQPDHARLAGQFADQWGNDRFGAPTPSPSVRIAAHTHDDGWWSYDRHPRLKADGTPYDFTELEAEPWIEHYEDGIETVVGVDRYAGLLVSMHGAGLRKRRYGLSPGWSETRAFGPFVDRQEELQGRLAAELSGTVVSEADRRLLSELHDAGSPTDAPEGSQLWRNYRLMQAWDTLSLSFCASISPPAYGPIGSVPTQPEEPDVTLRVEPVRGNDYRIDPYPFEVEPLEVTVPSRTVPRHSFESERSLIEAYYAADLEYDRFVMHHQ